jgi:MotA/TolQ/ExbB proton channel family
MAHISVHPLSSEPLDRGTRHDAGPSPVAAIIQRLSRDLSGPPAAAKTQPVETPAAETSSLPAANSASSIAFLSRCIVLQSIGAAGIAALWIAGLASKPFEVNGILAALITGIGLIGVVCVFLQRWRDVQWISTHVVRIGLLGTVIGLIAAFSSVRGGGSNDPNQIREMITAVVDGMYISLYATLLGIGCNLWLKVNLRLLGNFHG